MKKELKDLNRVVVCADPSYCRILKLLLEEIGVQQIHIVKDLDQVRSSLGKFKPDLCILDVHLGASPTSSVELTKFVDSIDCAVPIVFLTNTLTDAISQEVRKLSCSTVMTKDFSRLSLNKTIEYALLKQENNRLEENLAAATPQLATQNRRIDKASGPLFFKVGDKFTRIKKEQITFFFAENNMTYARVGKRNYPTNIKLKTLEDRLRPGFLRCHKTYLVNILNIESILIKEDRVKIGNELIPIGYVYRKPFLEQLDLIR